MSSVVLAPAPSEVFTPSRSNRHLFLRALLRRKIAMIAIAYLAIFYGAGILAPLVAPHDPFEQHITLEDRWAGPSMDHPLGTDSLGRDLLSRVMYASRTTIIFTVAVIITGGLFIGLTLGLLAGYRGGWVDTTILRVGEVVSGIPTIILMLTITAAFRTRIDDWSFWLRENTFLEGDARTFVRMSILIAASVPFGWIGSARIVRGQTFAIREQDYIGAAESMGASTWRIIWKHIFPGILPLFLVGLSSGMASIALLEVGLSYLGLGIDPPAASFGNMIVDSASVRFYAEHPHVFLAPAVPLILFIFAWNLLGDALIDIVQPRRTVR